MISELFRLYMKVLIMGTGNLELNCTRDEDRWGVEVQLHSFFTLLSIEVRSHPYSPAVLPR
jgi:hypothetical protein